MKRLNLVILAVVFLWNTNSVKAEWKLAFNTGKNGFGTQEFIKTGNGNIFAWDMSYGVFRSNDNGATWVNANSGKTISCFAVDDKNLFAGEDSWGKILKSTDHGENWVAITNGSPVTLPAIGMVVSGTHMLISSGNSSAPNGVGFYLSDDEGQNWRSPDSGNTIKYAKKFFQNNGKIYAGTAGDGIYVSSDGGKKWKDVSITGSGRLGVNTVNCFCVCQNQLFAGTQGGLFVSFDDGTSWRAVSDLSEYLSVRALAASGKNIFMGTWGNGLLVSTNSGVSWRDVNANLPADKYGGRAVISLFITEDDLLAGVSGQGIWRRQLYEMVQTRVEEQPDHPEQQEVSSPTAFQLAQNYPNPFNPETTIEFTVKTKSHVLLRVFNLMGKEVAILVDEIKSPGSYHVVWNAVNFSAGIYFYRLETSSFYSIKKMTLVR